MEEREYEHRILSLAERLSELCSEVSSELDAKRAKNTTNPSMMQDSRDLIETGSYRTAPEETRYLEPPIL